MSDGRPDSALLCTREQFLERVGISNGLLVGAQERGEVPTVHIGARTFIAWGAWQLRCLDLDDPARLGAFCRALGISNLGQLMTFLGGGEA